MNILIKWTNTFFLGSNFVIQNDTEMTIKDTLNLHPREALWENARKRCENIYFRSDIQTADLREKLH